MDKRGENHVWLSLCKPDGRDCLRSTCIVLATGAVAILALTLRIPRAGSFALAVPALLAMVLFPGMVLALLLRWDCREQDPPGHLAVWAAAGLSVLAGLGFIGIRTGVTLSGLMTITMMLYAAGMLAIAIRFFSNSTRSEGMEYRKVAVIILVCVAVTLALATLFTPRDTDDWFYLAHIRDYVNDIPINSENAIFDGGQPASPRAWYGGWWVAEAMLSRAAGVDPVRFHQVLLPLLLLPFAVFALFMLAREIFRSEKAAYLACFLQVVFFISSAYPSDSAGWAFLCRTAQDKTVACLIMVPVVTALALRLWKRISCWEWREDSGSYWRLWALYGFCLVGSTLVHPMAAVWSAVAILPFLAVEALRDRRRRTAMALVLILIPFVVSGLILMEGRMATISTLEGRVAGPHEGKGVSSFFAPHFPGGGGRFKAGDRVLAISERLHIGHPLLVTRYPLAMLGLVLTFVLLKYIRRSSAARYLAVLTFTVLLFTFAPGIANLTSAAITRKMLYRLTWLLPWGLTTAFVLTRISPRARWAWLIAILVALAICKGNPTNYFTSLYAARDTARTKPELAEVLRALKEEPSPQGVVLASAQASLRVPGFAGDAYPVTFRLEGPRTQADLRDLFQNLRLEGRVREEIEALGVRYVIAEKSLPLGQGFERGAAWVQPVYGNRGYGLYKIEFPGPADGPSRD